MTANLPIRSPREIEELLVQCKEWYRENLGPFYSDPRFKNDRERRKDAAFLEKWKEYIRRDRLIRDYGITLEEYAMLFLEQDGVCAICLQPERRERNLCVDHDHETGLVRGLLCNKCNKALGGFDDRVDLIEAALQYLINHQTD